MFSYWTVTGPIISLHRIRPRLPCPPHQYLYAEVMSQIRLELVLNCFSFIDKMIIYISFCYIFKKFKHKRSITCTLILFLKKDFTSGQEIKRDFSYNIKSFNMNYNILIIKNKKYLFYDISMIIILISIFFILVFIICIKTWYLNINYITGIF